MEKKVRSTVINSKIGSTFEYNVKILVKLDRTLLWLNEYENEYSLLLKN